MLFSLVKLLRRWAGAGRCPIAPAIFAVLVAAAVDVRAETVPFSAVALLSGPSLRCLRGAPESNVALLACAERCAPIPWQLDERDVRGELVLEKGPEPTFDDPPGVIDGNDEVRWMATDAGRRLRDEERPAGALCLLEVRQATADGDVRWVYASVGSSAAPRSPRRYVRYDEKRDIIRSERVSLGFGGPTPRHLSLRGAGGKAGPNLLDRLKVRVSAWFLGIIPVHLDEGSVRTEFVGWHEGAVRVVRRQRQWVYVGFGLRSPTFGSYTYFYRDFAELPVSLRLNFPPTYFFRRIRVEAVLDFRDLRGWRLLAARMPEPLMLDSIDEKTRKKLEELPGDWFALLGPRATLLEVLGTSPSLARVRRRLLYRSDDVPREPEDVVGEHPGVGYRLTDWGEVGSGRHWFASTSYALPLGMDVHDFLRRRNLRLILSTRDLSNPAPRALFGGAMRER